MDEFHARLRGNILFFRIFYCGAYVTERMTKDEAFDYSLERFIKRNKPSEESVCRYVKLLKKNLDQAEKRGTSAFVRHGHDLKGPWRK